MGFKFGSRLDPKAASAKGSEDSGAAEDTPLTRLRAGLGLQPSAPALSASAAVEAKRVEPQISRPAEVSADEDKSSVVAPSEAKPVEVRRVQVRAPEMKPAEPKPLEVTPVETPAPASKAP